MIDLNNRENVIKALELCTSKIEARTQIPCETCPYHNEKYHGVHGDGCCNARSLQRDALALLKAQSEDLDRLKLCRHECKIECLLDEYNKVVAERDALRKAQEPRVMTLEEVEDALDTVIWVDRPDFDNSSDEYALIKSYSRKEGYMTIAYFCGYHDATMFYNLYGTKWRCWDKRPTDEQREDTPWN